MLNSYTADYHGTFRYGSGSIVFGFADLRTTDVYAGGALTTTMTWSTDPSVRVSDLRMMRQRLNTTGSSAGTPVTPAQWEYCGAVTSCQRKVPVTYSNSSTEQAVWHEANWWLSGFPGHFWAYAKSLEAHWTSSGYAFYPQMYTPPSPQGAGWTK